MLAYSSYLLLWACHEIILLAILLIVLFGITATCGALLIGLPFYILLLLINHLSALLVLMFWIACNIRTCWTFSSSTAFILFMILSFSEISPLNVFLSASYSSLNFFISASYSSLNYFLSASYSSLNLFNSASFAIIISCWD